MTPTNDFARELCRTQCRQAVRALPSSVSWIPEIPEQWPAECLDVIDRFLPEHSRGTRRAEEICCGNISAAAAALGSSSPAGGHTGSPPHGLPAVLLRTPLCTEPEVPVMAALAARVPRLTVVIDHFRHGELVSAAAKSAGRTISVLIAVDTGRQMPGVHPGPDCESLSRAVVGQEGLQLRGIFADTEPLESAAALQGLSAGRALQLARQCLRHLRSRGMAAEDVVLGLGTAEALTTGTELNGCTVVWGPPGMSSGALSSAAPATVEVGGKIRVISRPALEFCVIAAGSRSGLITAATRVLAPFGAEITAWNAHHSRLHLAGAAVDLRIGDAVTLGNFHNHT
ncbi:MAG: alanine racemase [Planctomycetota bacterium]